MDETHSELTKISTLAKRTTLKVDKTNEISSRTTEKSFTEISEVTDLSIYKILRNNFNNINYNNDILDSETLGTGYLSSEQQFDEKSTGTVYLTFERDQISIRTHTETLDEEDFQREILTVHDKSTLETVKETAGGENSELVSEATNSEVLTRDLVNKIVAPTELVSIEVTAVKSEVISDMIDKSEELEPPDTIALVHRYDSNVEPVDSAEGADLLNILDYKYDKSNLLPITGDLEHSEDPNLLTGASFTEDLEMLDKHKGLLTAIHNAMSERKNLTFINNKYQTKLFDHFRRKKPDAAMKMQKLLQQQESTIVDIDQRYEKYLRTVLVFQVELTKSENENIQITETGTRETLEQEHIINTQENELMAYRHEFAITAANSHTGRKISPHDWEVMINSEKKKSVIVQSVRLANIKLQNKVNKLYATLVSKESIGNKLSILDFEQYKIENQAYNEKLEEKKELTRRIGIKINNNIHILTHMKEKIHCLLKERHSLTDKEKKITTIVNCHRRKLTKTKKGRDLVISNNEKTLRLGGLLNEKDLIKHYETTLSLIDLQNIRMKEMTEMIGHLKQPIKSSQLKILS